MKFTILFFLPFFVFTTTVCGDNWELFPSNQVTYFHFTNDWTDAISPFYVDYVETHNEADYQYILRSYIEELSGGCYESFHTNEEYNLHFPNEVIVHQNGWYGETVFEANPSNLPTLIFDTQAEV